jgi:hypothetical protein
MKRASALKLMLLSFYRWESNMYENLGGGGEAYLILIIG